MRLDLLGRLSPVQKIFSFVMRTMLGGVPGPIQVFSYKKKLFGLQMTACFSEAMRGPSVWSAGERELMAAIASKSLRCRY